MNTGMMQALRIEVEGPVTSFRYPYFVQGEQPTYEMPPPATLYGHVCSALGAQVPPGTFRVALCFTYTASFTDYEHTHLFGREAKLSPFRRHLLFQPRLILYLDRPEWADAFRRPRYLVTLGRSQDLMHYRRVSVVTLQAARQAYAEHTLLPLESAISVGAMVAVTMPRYITPDRRVSWGQYAMIRQRQLVTGNGDSLWVDPETDPWRGVRRAVIWLTYPVSPS